MSGGATWPDEDTRALLDWVTTYLQDAGLADADDHALAIVVHARWLGWRRTAIRPAEDRRHARRADPATAHTTAARIRADLGWLPDTPDDTGDDTP